MPSGWNRIILHDNWEYEEFQSKVDETKDLVEKILEKYPEARDNDPLLYFLVLWMKHRNLMVKLAKAILMMEKEKVKVPSKEFVEILYNKIFENMTSPETVTRCRRIIQHDEGKYRPSKHVELERAKREEIWRSYSVTRDRY